MNAETINNHWLLPGQVEFDVPLGIQQTGGALQPA